jgi:hypothetical protein
MKKTKIMVNVLLFIAIGLVVIVALKTFEPTKKNTKILEEYNKQNNPFYVPKDSSEIVWARASEFLETRKPKIIGGELEINDSVIYMPYYNDFNKGTSLKIAKKTFGDSTLFKIEVWNSGKPQPLGAKEIALFLRTGYGRKKF